MPHLVRVGEGPIITPESSPTIGDNINGPSLIEVPSWVSEPLGRYYLYFASHEGDHIRLAYADQLTGPWKVHRPGVLSLADSRFLTKAPAVSHDEDLVTPHIASPDVRIDESYRTITMYFHGLESVGVQLTRHASSIDGLSFDVDPPTIDGTYLRGFRYNETEYALVMPGRVLRRIGRPTEFDEGPSLLPVEARHSAVQVAGDQLRIFWTRVGDAPERILMSTVDATLPWARWSASEPIELLRPEMPWEGAAEPLSPSVRGAAPGPVNQLRDPAIFVDGGRTFIVCSIAGESGLALNELRL